MVRIKPFFYSFFILFGKEEYFLFSFCQKGDDFTSIFDLADMRENVHYKRHDHTIVSRPKESVQGSIEMEKLTYILQWMVPPTAEHSAQLMYFYEILSSANYRGSMTSLQSGLSALSLASR